MHWVHIQRKFWTIFKGWIRIRFFLAVGSGYGFFLHCRSRIRNSACKKASRVKDILNRYLVQPYCCMSMKSLYMLSTLWKLDKTSWTVCNIDNIEDRRNFAISWESICEMSWILIASTRRIPLAKYLYQGLPGFLETAIIFVTSIDHYIAIVFSLPKSGNKICVGEFEFKCNL